MNRCNECGSWEAECGSDTPVAGCGCARCANHRANQLEQTVNTLERRLDSFYDGNSGLECTDCERLTANGTCTECRDGTSPLKKAQADTAHALETIHELRRKLAEAGVEGSPPPGGDTTIGILMARAQNAEAAAERLRNVLIDLKERSLTTGPCYCFLWPDEESESEAVMAREGHCSVCEAARAALAQ